ncbi:FxSxx-COOH cyclophane-containing RiPP peptide [Streptomonospora algeriensis]|uniref:FxSxx-COOH cyclophane-containing RiPP peptide n=1 Tax=Streptomonospora algeriensis TaxID=995084 RepID=A0ABW3BDS0_9ACTN
MIRLIHPNYALCEKSNFCGCFAIFVPLGKLDFCGLHRRAAESSRALSLYRYHSSVGPSAMEPGDDSCGSELLDLRGVDLAELDGLEDSALTRALQRVRAEADAPPLSVARFEAVI